MKLKRYKEENPIAKKKMPLKQDWRDENYGGM